MAFRSDARAYRHAWDFLSQIVNYRDPLLHRRAILAGLLVRNLHVKALIPVIDTSSIELTGLAVVAQQMDDDHSVSTGAATDLEAPTYDGDRTMGGRTPEQIALAKAVDEVNKMFAASGLDLGNGSGEAWTRAVWGAVRRRRGPGYVG